MAPEIFHDKLIDNKHLSTINSSALKVANLVSERYSEIKNNYPDGYMSFAKGSPSTELYECYNVFLSPYPGLSILYRNVINYFKSKCNNFEDYYVAGWVNVYRYGTNLEWHKHGSDYNEHDLRWHGYVTINGEPSITYYKNKDNSITEIKNKNGYITLSDAGLYHKVSNWQEDFPRITIAFDFVLQNQIDEYNITRWIPVT